MDEIVILYKKKEHQNLELPNHQPALLISCFFWSYDRLWSRKSKKIVSSLPKSPKILQIYSNQLHHLKWAKALKMSMLKLSVLKLLQVKYIMDLFNYLTSETNRGIISNGWKVVFITEAICSGLNTFDPLDPFQGINPLANTVMPSNNDYPWIDVIKQGRWWRCQRGRWWRYNNILDIIEYNVEETYDLLLMIYFETKTITKVKNVTNFW